MSRESSLAPLANSYGSSLMGMSTKYTNYLRNVKRQPTDEGPRGAQIFAVTDQEPVYFEEGQLIFVDVSARPMREEFGDTSMYSKRNLSFTPNIPHGRVMPLNALNAKFARDALTGYEDYSQKATNWRPLGFVRVVHPDLTGQQKGVLLEYVHYGMVKKVKQLAVLQPTHQLVVCYKIVVTEVNGATELTLRIVPMGLDRYQVPRRDLISLGVHGQEKMLGHSVNAHLGLGEWVCAFVEPIGKPNLDARVKGEHFNINLSTVPETGQYALDHPMLISTGQAAKDAQFEAQFQEQFHLAMPAYL